MIPTAVTSLLLKMKFWQRFLILGSALFLMGTVYYYSVLDSNAVDLNLPKRQRRDIEDTLLGDSASSSTSLKKILESLPWMMDPDICSLLPGCEEGKGVAAGEEKRGGSSAGSRCSGSPHPNSNLSTVDVFHEAEFNVLADGMYELPSPPSEFPSDREGLGRAGSASAGSPKLPERLNVVIMPHSHVDPGWQKTTREYYTDQTKHILTNMVRKLTEHPDLTFVWAETIYFAMWWNELEDAVKVHVRRLIRRGQLEVVLGGWVMPDEASSHYVSLIDQLLEGHQWLWENLGVSPQNSWSIDPFGYSGTAPYLWKLAGMDNMVIQRVHQAVKASLMSQRSLEFFWRQFWDNSHPPQQRGVERKGGFGGGEAETDILCHVMPYMLYSIMYSCGPNRFVCQAYDYRSPVPATDHPVFERPGVDEKNVERLAKPLYRQFRQKAHFYRFNTILVPLGDDFRFDVAAEWDQQYGNYSRLMRYMNDRKDWNIHVRFGTLRDYFRLTRENQLARRFTASSGGKGQAEVEAAEFPILSGDFFPYSDRDLDHWTGYYTTRPFDKKFQREVQSLIQAADIAVTLTYAFCKRWGREVGEKFFYLASLMHEAHRRHAQFMHHDAITGTSRFFVVADYEARLLAAYTETQLATSRALQVLVSRDRADIPEAFQPETQRHEHDQPPEKVRLSVPEDTGLVVLAFNPLPQYRQQPVRILVDTNHIRVQTQQRKTVLCQINPVWDNQDPTRVRADIYEVVFIAELPPLATVPYMIVRDDGGFPQASSYPAKVSVFNSPTLEVPMKTNFAYKQPQAERAQSVSIGNEKLRIRVDPQSGKLVDMEDMATGNVTVLDMGLEMYRSQNSGAYIFRPKGGSEPLPPSRLLVRVVEGPIMSEITVLHLGNSSQTFTLYHHLPLLSSGIHIRNDLDIRNLKDREVIMRMKTDLRLGEPPEFFSDQNGMQYIRRRTKDNTGAETNYYPMTSGAFLQDGAHRLSLLSAQPHGVASLAQSWLEVMLDRHLLTDDGRGLGQPVNDIKPVTSHFILLLETRPSPRSLGDTRTAAHYAFPSLLSWALADRLQQPVQLFYSHSISAEPFLSSFHPLRHSPSSSPFSSFPCDLALISLRSLTTRNLNYNGTSLILHRRAYDCDFPASVELLQCPLMGKLLPTFRELLGELGAGARSVRETSLTHLHHKRSLSLSDRLEMRPMQISSFQLTF